MAELAKLVGLRDGLPVLACLAVLAGQDLHRCQFASESLLLTHLVVLAPSSAGNWIAVARNTNWLVGCCVGLARLAALVAWLAGLVGLAGRLGVLEGLGGPGTCSQKRKLSVVRSRCHAFSLAPQFTVMLEQVRRDMNSWNGAPLHVK